MRILMRQISGLGNQLFQYAAGRYFSTHYAAPVGMVIDPARKAFSHGHPRPFLLEHFAIATPFRELSEWDHLMFSQKPALRPLLGLLHAVTRTQVFVEPVTQRYTFLANLPLNPGIATLYLGGYWQSFQMVDAVEPLLRNELRFKREAEGKNRELLQQIRNTPNPVSLHVRRGDYTLAAEGNRALPLSYYHAAIAHFRQRLADPTFFVFSDDIAFARANLPQHARCVFVDHNDDASSHEDLRLMSACHHHIIANSSFSWWGAWLNPSPAKLVYAPRFWVLSEDTYYPGLFPSHWTLDALNSLRQPA